MPPLSSRPSLRLATLSLAMLALAAAPALAARSLHPLTTAPGAEGSAIRFSFTGRLGGSGMLVQSTPTMVLLRSVAADSPAALADLPDPKRYRVRLAAIDGQAVENVALPDLLAAFAPEHDEVRVTMGRKTDGEYSETLVGPFLLPLSAAKINRQRAEWLAARKRFAEARDVLGAGLALDEIGQRALLEAHDLAAAGDHRTALSLTAGIPAGDPLHADAMRLRARVQEARSAELVSRADIMASQGDYTGGLDVLRSVASEGSWGVLRRLREHDWGRAVRAREAYRRDAGAIRAAKAKEAADAQAEANAAARRRADAAEAAREERRKRLAGRRRIKL